MVTSSQSPAPDKQRWKGCDVHERQTWLKDLFIAYPAVAEILGDLGPVNTSSVHQRRVRS
jgi:hypothetical protein